MPASAHGAVQTDAHDGRKFITIKVGSNGKVRYRKVYLRTRNGLVARRRARVIEELSDVEEARAELEAIDCDFGEYAKGEIPDKVVDDWRLAHVAEDQKKSECNGSLSSSSTNWRTSAATP